MKKWFKIEYEDEYGEKNAKFMLAVTEQQALNDCVFDLNFDGEEATNIAVIPLTSKEEEKLAEQDEISRFMANGCTKAEAVRHIKEGSISILAADWNEWAVENNYCDEDGQPITINQIRNSKDDGIAIINAADGGEYVLLYVL